MCRPLEPTLDAKYAKLWNEANCGEIPQGFEAHHLKNGELSERESSIFTEGMWRVLDSMANDDLISQAALRKAHEAELGWPAGKSKIRAGYVPVRVVDQESAA